MTIQKRSNINIASDLGTCHKYVVQFTDPNLQVIDMPKELTLTFLNMLILNTIQ